MQQFHELEKIYEALCSAEQHLLSEEHAASCNREFILSSMSEAKQAYQHGIAHAHGIDPKIIQSLYSAVK
jgi:hypothetical protein